jgi:hypothetical protein
MVVVEFLKTYHHTKRRTWHPGDRPTILRDLCVQLMISGTVKYLGEGCGCLNQADKF